MINRVNTREKPKVTVVDSIMGSGKTSWAIEYINNSDSEQKFIFITPYLEQVDRIMSNVNRDFHTPDTKNKFGSKRYDLENLILQGKNIVSTHALFKTINQELLEWIYMKGYILIIDEVIEVIDIKQISKYDYDTLVNQGIIRVENDGKITWSEEYRNYEGKFIELKNYAINNCLYVHSRSGNKTNKLLVWTFPVSIFKAFKEVYILTYLFDGQLQKNYYDLFNINYQYKSIECKNGNYALCDYIGKDKQDRESIKKLINIYEGNLNDIGNGKYDLSSTWLKDKDNIHLIDTLRKNVSNYFKNKVKTKSEVNMWTTIKGDEDKNERIKNSLKGKGYIDGFVPCNARATNEYSHKESLAYLLNRYLNPMDKAFFQDKGITVDEDLWALSELIQWIWRSRIRNGEEINIYLPSKRMRTLLSDYLNGEI